VRVLCCLSTLCSGRSSEGRTRRRGEFSQDVLSGRGQRNRYVSQPGKRETRSNFNRDVRRIGPRDLPTKYLAVEENIAWHGRDLQVLGGGARCSESGTRLHAAEGRVATVKRSTQALRHHGFGSFVATLGAWTVLVRETISCRSLRRSLSKGTVSVDWSNIPWQGNA